MSVSSLCQLCGLCCDGSLFAWVALSPDEANALIERDVAVGMWDDGNYRLPQRCSALSGTRCTVYDARPDGCRVYVCNLATALEQGEVSFDEAARTVAEARRRIESLAQATGSESPIQHVRRSHAGDAPALSDEAQREWESAREYLRRHFTGRHGLS